jgi:uncharacterized protein YutE (UPF0331/DUF86 family)
LVTENGEGERPSAFTPLQAIQTLAEEGYIENEAAEDLRKMVKLRNAVVHGDFSIEVTAGQIEGLLKQLRAIASQIKAVQT